MPRARARFSWEKFEARLEQMSHEFQVSVYLAPPEAETELDAENDSDGEFVADLVEEAREDAVGPEVLEPEDFLGVSIRLPAPRRG
jgi:hypothetical protein